MPKVPQISLHVFAISPKKTWGMKLIFCLQINIARYAQSTQNNKFLISLQYLKENVENEVDFLPGDKQRFLEIDFVIFGVCGKACPNYPK